MVSNKPCPSCGSPGNSPTGKSLREEDFLANLQSILDNALDGFAIFTRGLRLIMLNRALQNIVREITGKLPGKTFDVFEFIKPGKGKKIQHVIAAVLEGEMVEYELLHYTAEMRKKWLHVNIYPVKSETGTSGICVGIRDITILKKNIETVSYNASLLDNMRDAVISTDLDFCIVSLNKAAEELCQVTVHEAIGHTPMDMFDYTYVNSSMEEAISEVQERGSWRGKFIFNRKDGKTFYLSSTITPVKDEEDNVTGYLVVHTDNTDKVRLNDLISRQQAYIHSVFESAPQALFLINPDYSIVIFNNMAKLLMRQFMGVSIECGMNLPEILPPFRRNDVSAKLQRVISGQSFEYEVLYPGNRWLMVSLIPVKDKSGRVTEICVGLRDVTVQKNQELKIQKSEEKYRSLVDSMAEGVIYQSADRKVVTCNNSAERILGVTKDMILTEGFPLSAWRLFNERKEEVNFKEVIYKKMRDLGSVREFTLGVKRESGIQWLCMNMEAVYDGNAEIKGYVLTFSDITRQRKKETELKILLMAARRINNSVVITDANRKVVWVNKAFTYNTGYSFSEVRGKVPGHVLQGPETDSQTIKLMRDALQQETTFECDVLNYKKSGEKFWMHIQVQPLYDKSGNITGFLGIGANITEQKELQEKLVQQRLQRQKEITLATISGQEKERNEIGRELHDNINQILAATKMQLETHLKSRDGRPECIENSREYLTLAMQEIRSLSRRLVSPRFKESKLLNEIDFVIGNLGLTERLRWKQTISLRIRSRKMLN